MLEGAKEAETHLWIPSIDDTFLKGKNNWFFLKLITFEILAAERLRLIGFDNQLIFDCFANAVNKFIW